MIGCVLPFSNDCKRADMREPTSRYCSLSARRRPTTRAWQGECMPSNRPFLGHLMRNTNCKTGSWRTHGHCLRGDHLRSFPMQKRCFSLLRKICPRLMAGEA